MKDDPIEMLIDLGFTQTTPGYDPVSRGGWHTPVPHLGDNINLHVNIRRQQDGTVPVIIYTLTDAMERPDEKANLALLIENYTSTTLRKIIITLIGKD